VAGVFSPESYQLGEDPYLISRITAAAMAELRVKREMAKSAKKPEPVAAYVDPEAARQRAEAAQLLKDAKLRVEEAKATAQRLISSAQEEIEHESNRSREEGFSQGLSRGSEQGYEEGLKKGEEEGLGHWAELIGRWQGLLEATVKEKEAYFIDREPALVELSLKIASKILAKEVSQKPEDIQYRVLEAIKKVNDRQVLAVYLNPEDLAKAVEMGSGGVKNVHGIKQIEFLADDKVVRGGVRIESGSETIDAGLDTQLAEVAKKLLAEASHGD
jgi:flagellar assembly protein FliH